MTERLYSDDPIGESLRQSTLRLNTAPGGNINVLSAPFVLAVADPLFVAHRVAAGADGINVVDNGALMTLDISVDGTVVRTSRLISTGDGLQGGGDLSADRTLSVDTSVVRTSRQIISGDGLSGGGDLSADRTLVVDASVVRTTRSIISGAGLQGGGTLSVDRTLSIDLAFPDSGLSLAGDELAVGAGDGLSLNGGLVDVDATVVRTSRLISTGNGLSGGGDLSADRSLAVDLVPVSSGLDFNAGQLQVNPGSGLELNLTLNVLLAASNPGLEFFVGSLRMGTPLTLNVTSINEVSGAGHAHDISTSDGSTVSMIVATDSNRGVRFGRLAIGAQTIPTADARVRIGPTSVIGMEIISRSTPDRDLVFYGIESGALGVSYVRAVPRGSASNVRSTFQAFLTDYVADTTNWESVELAGDGNNDVGWLRTNSGGTGALRTLYITAGTTLADGLNIDAATGDIEIGRNLEVIGAVVAPTVSGRLNFALTRTSVFPVTAAGLLFESVIDYNTTIRRFIIGTFVATTNDGSNYWTIELRHGGGSITSFNTSSDSASNWIRHSVALSFSLLTSQVFTFIRADPTGSPGSLYLTGPSVWID